MHQRLFHLLLAFAFSLPLAAQSGLNIAKLFDGRFHKQKDATEVLMKGKKTSVYKLSLFRSLTLANRNANASSIEPLVLADGRSAIDKELATRGGHLAYAFYQLPSKGNTRRYIFYRNNSLNPSATASRNITLIYMEGTATLEDLKHYFKK